MTTKTIVLSSSNLSEETREILFHLFKQNPEENYFVANKEYLLSINDESLSIKLTHDILKRRSKKHAEQFRYEVLDKTLGKGAFATVKSGGFRLKVKDNTVVVKLPSAFKALAVKQVNVSPGKSPKAMVKSEYELSLRVPSFCAKPLVEAGNYMFLLMRQLSGNSLRKILNWDCSGINALTIEQRLKITIGAIKALQELHTAGVIHGDIKPENMIVNGVDSDFHPKDALVTVSIIDLGLGAEADKENDCVNGTPGYMCPLVLEGKGISRVADAYSLGITLCELWGTNLRVSEMQHANRADLLLARLPNFEAQSTQLQDDVRSLLKLLVDYKTLKELSVANTLNHLCDGFEAILARFEPKPIVEAPETPVLLTRRISQMQENLSIKSVLFSPSTPHTDTSSEANKENKASAGYVSAPGF